MSLSRAGNRGKKKCQIFAHYMRVKKFSFFFLVPPLYTSTSPSLSLCLSHCLYLLIKCWRCPQFIINQANLISRWRKYLNCTSFQLCIPYPSIASLSRKGTVGVGEIFEKFWNNCVSQRQAAFVVQAKSIRFELIWFANLSAFSFTFPLFHIFTFSAAALQILSPAAYISTATSMIEANYHSSVPYATCQSRPHAYLCTYI